MSPYHVVSQRADSIKAFVVDFAQPDLDPLAALV